MPFRSRSRNRLRPINRIKHVIDRQGGIVVATQSTQVIANAVDAPVIGTTDQVETGSTINGIYLKCEVYATSSAALSNVYLAVAKNPGNNLTFPNINVVGSDDNKKYVIHQEMVMLEKKVAGNPRTIFNGVIAIPRGYRRQGPNDRLVVLLFSPGIQFEFCLQCHYKEFR